MGKHLSQFLTTATLTLLTLALLTLAPCLTTLADTVPIETQGGTVELSVIYEGSGPVNENHGLIVFVFGGPDLSDPTTPILATRYLPINKTRVRFTQLEVDEVWLVAVYDEKGGYTTGPLPGPFGVYSEEPTGAPTGVRVGRRDVEFRFADANRMPAPKDAKLSASFDTLQNADGGIVEVRIYHVKPGKRDEFVRFFEKTLQAQADVGLRVPGQFRSLDDENTFVWVRAFRNQKERQERSRAFYFGPEWIGKRHATAAQLIDSAEVMLLEPTALSGIR